MIRGLVPPQEDFTLDPLGNYITQQSQVLKEQNRLASDFSHAYAYDLEGRVMRQRMTDNPVVLAPGLPAPNRDFNWNALCELIQVVDRSRPQDIPSNWTWRATDLTYDALGRLMGLSTIEQLPGSVSGQA